MFMLSDVLEFCPPVEGVQRLDFLFASSVAVTSRLSGAVHLVVISLSADLSFSLRLRCDAEFFIFFFCSS